MCSTPGDTNTTTGSVLRGFADKHPETQKCCNGIWSWGFVEDLLTCHSPHWWIMPASVLNQNSLAQESSLRESGSVWGWWQKGVSVEVGINTLPGWSRWSGLWKPCQSRCTWPETQFFPTSTVQQWLEGSRAFTTAVTMCSKHREWLQQRLHSCLWQYVWIFTLLQK